MTAPRDHGGGIDAAATAHGGTRADWLDLSTGINPVAYPLPAITADAWTALPDQAARDTLESAARKFWNIPAGAGILAVPGASSAIAQIPRLAPAARVYIPAPTYNEHAASFAAQGWEITQDPAKAQASVLVNPNNPDGRQWQADATVGRLRVIDESFGEVTPDATLIAQAAEPGTVVLKSFGKFWGLAGVRLGFVIAEPALLDKLATMLGPWAVAGPALQIGAAALGDAAWADVTRSRLTDDAARLDEMMLAKGADLLGGTSLFRLYEVEDAVLWQARLAEHHIWTRVFPYNPRWLRLGLPAADGWARLSAALA
ncbi:L-threonine O-3-phosphate decarboxylase [Sulfitobacter brevis]|uniref:threonine-phosphate decarboxylase n=1 Tax=Sulfitobacter brevis TaxID=74348 RepID=A0A1I2DFX3_9RHOB|nr:threonine-phosphate decarboxylase CobD [Sulfitobacter brevis]SFE79512.1 L-threonine O-3-phosphate decarboxylase [Sulfitobacter brevis]